MTRILRATVAGGKAYNPKSIAGIINSAGAPREGSAKDAKQLRAFAQLRSRAQREMEKSIGSQGEL